MGQNGRERSNSELCKKKVSVHSGKDEFLNVSMTDRRKCDKNYPNLRRRSRSTRVCCRAFQIDARIRLLSREVRCTCGASDSNLGASTKLGKSISGHVQTENSRKIFLEI